MKKSYCENQKTIITKAKEEDFEDLITLINALADYEKLQRPDNRAQKRLKEHAFGSNPLIEVWISKVNEKAAGYAIICQTYSSFLALPTLYLEDIFILPEFRSKGIGKELFKHCVKIALEKGCGRMDWQVLDWNKLAIDFYNKTGARQLNEWLNYRLTSEDIKRFLERN
jgi:GNAT superfamily N-acetyltransferase